MLRNGSASTNQSKKSREKRIISRNDILLILLLLVLAVTALLFLQMNQKKGASVEVTIDGVVYGNYDLDQERTISIEGEDFVSTLRISQGQANMTQADCPDQICVNHRAISHKGETIVCLPHKVVVEVKNSAPVSGDVDVIVK